MKTKVIKMRQGYSLLFLAAAIPLLALVTLRAHTETVVSRPGDYAGYSRPVYGEWVRASEYITVRDGTKLAADIFRPARHGQPVDDPLPVVWTYDRYHRADLKKGQLYTQLEQEPWLTTVLKHGYVIGVIDVRGTGASFGVWREPFTEKEAEDGYDITEWFAAQPWCNKRVGMYGRSYLGITQYLTAAAAPPHLRAIFPEMAMFDLYSFVYPGGVFRSDFAEHWGRLVKRIDTESLAVPVTDDKNGESLAAAVEMHRSNSSIGQLFEALPYRDGINRETKNKIYFTSNPSNYLGRVKKSGVAIYHLSGWNDLWPRDALLWYKNLDNPQKLIIGPWSHDNTRGFDLAAEHLRWYDYWLKDIDNGIMREAPIHYFTMGAPPGREWRSATRWPLPDERPTRYYLHGGKSGSVASVNDGTLDTQRPADAKAEDLFTVDYTASSGSASRWANGYGGVFGYGNMTPNDQKGLTYTTAQLDADMEVTGHPVVHLWINSKAKDTDFFVYLEEVDKFGNSQYITEGALRASHRKTSTPPFDNLQLPFHRGFEKDKAELGGEPVELVFDLLPTSNIFDAGNRIRVTITGADRDNTATPELNPPPSVSILRSAARASFITLPVIPSAASSIQTLPPAQMTRTEPAAAPRTVLPLGVIMAATALLLVAFVFIFAKRTQKRF
jgi:putative CocE/NonD family hydrolase